MKYKLCLILTTLLIFLLLPPQAMADAGLEAEWRDGRIAVRWTECGGAATLTVYNEGWPVLVTNVDCGSGQYLVPAAYTAAKGTYSVRLRTESACLAAPVSGGVPATPRPVGDPVPADSPNPTDEPTREPTAAPTAVPTPRPTPVPTAAPQSDPGSVDGGLAAEVVAQVNQERAAQGLGMLSVDADLTAAARIRAREIVRKFSHTRPDGSSWSTVSSRVRGENIAMGQRTADKVMAAWMSSEGHRANILRPGFRTIGVCALRVNGIVYWVQLFGS